VAQIETDKVTIPVNAPVAGRVARHHAQPGDTVEVGAELFTLDTDAGGGDVRPDARERAVLGKVADGNAGAADAGSAGSKGAGPRVEPKTSTRSDSKGAGALKGSLDGTTDAASDSTVPKEQASKESARQEDANAPRPSGQQSASTTTPNAEPSTAALDSGEGTYTERMSRMRMRIAERMKEAQNRAASLTTFNEVDMGALARLRKEHGKAFSERHGGTRLGYVSPVIKASAYLLSREMPVMNARISDDGTSIVHSRSVDVSVAVATPRGLVTPVLRDAASKSLAEIEAWLADAGTRARDNKMTLAELAGGTFTVSNGGVFGSLLGTPILNPPQSAVLGMHAIRDRPVAVNGEVVVRPMMYVALTYDHRLVDGREAATFLVRLRALLEDPALFALDI